MLALLMTDEITLREHNRRIGKLGGKARQDSMSDAERTEFATAGGDARAASLTKERRSAIAKKAAAARWGEKKAGKGKGKPKLTAPSKRGTSAK